MLLEEFENVRQWKKIRGIGGSETMSRAEKLQSQMQRVFQEIVEIHEAIVLSDEDELQDAIGDSIVTLINIADIAGYNAEECLSKAFNVIKYRKGITRETGDFIRYGKLVADEDKMYCDEMQGNPSQEYFDPEVLSLLTPVNFRK